MASTKEQQVSSVLNALLDGGWIERYHVKGQRMLTRQSVAEHSWRMAAAIFAVASQLRADVVLAALFHDVSERVTGHIPSNVKKLNPDIQQAVHEVSTAEEVRLGIRFNLTDEEKKLVAWADAYEGTLHCLDEYELGNRKIVPTLERYHSYSRDSKFKLADKASEERRLELMYELNFKTEQDLQWTTRIAFNLAAITTSVRATRSIGICYLPWAMAGSTLPAAPRPT